MPAFPNAQDFSARQGIRVKQVVLPSLTNGANKEFYAILMKDRDIDWTNIWEVERDICCLYHELSEVRGIIGDLAFGSLYTLSYWEFLDLSAFQMPETERRFIREGCLVFILAMAWDVIDGSGSYLLDKIGQCQQAVNDLIAIDDKERQLIFTVNLALATVENNAGSSDELEQLSVWVNQIYVCGYFERRSIKAP